MSTESDFSVITVATATDFIDSIIDTPYMDPVNPCENCKFYNVNSNKCESPRKDVNPHRARKLGDCYSHEEIRYDEGGMKNAF